MAHELKMGEDGILRITISGDMDKSIVEIFQRDYYPFLEASTQENPLNNLIFSGRLGKLSSAARRFFTQLNHDPRYGMVALVDPPRRARVLGRFILKATNRDNINFFDSEEQALTWLKSRM